MKALLKAFAVMLGLAIPSYAALAEIVAGVSDNPKASLAQPGRTNFDPPSGFSQTLPLMTYMNRETGMEFLMGDGAVLNQSSNFAVSGFSAPNFLAWNCNAANFDGTIPALPEIIALDPPVSMFMATIGSGLGVAGDAGGLVAFAGPPTFQFIDFDVVAIPTSGAMQKVSVSGARISFVAIIGPCIMVADDIEAQQLIEASP